jgi:hypothetical protein
MKWDELPPARQRLVLQALDLMAEQASQISSEEVGLSRGARDAREVIDAAIEKLRESP